MAEDEEATDRVARRREVYLDAEDGEGGSTLTGVTSDEMSVTRGSRSERVDRSGFGGMMSLQIRRFTAARTNREENNRARAR